MASAMNTQAQISKRGLVRPIHRESVQDIGGIIGGIIGGSVPGGVLPGETIGNGLDFEQLLADLQEKIPFILLSIIAIVGMLIAIAAFVV